MRDAAPIRLESYVVGNTGRFELLHIECESEDGKAVGHIDQSEMPGLRGHVLRNPQWRIGGGRARGGAELP